MFFEKNKFFQRVGWCSGRNHFYRNSEGVNRNLCKNLRNLLQDPAELVSGFRTLRQEKTRLFETVLLFFGSVRSNCWNGRPFFRLKHPRKRLRDSILSPIFHSYIFAIYKNESLWI